MLEFDSFPVARFALCVCGDNQQALSTAQSGSDTVADTVYTNGRIYTVSEAQLWAEAVAIEDGKFLVVGSTTKDEITVTLTC